MGAMSLDVLKDLLGLIGSILAIVPFMRDFVQRQKISRLAKRNNPVFRESAKERLAKEKEKLREPNSADLSFVMTGILLLIASFAVSLYISLHEAFKV
jgi:hypothetical protein